MRSTLYTLTLIVCILCLPLATFAQRITHTYNNVSLSEALLELNNEQKEYDINFLYNELEDFRVTATIKNKRLPDAIQQMIGFYPVRMTVKPEDHEIYVECTHKTDRHLTGTIIDEQGQPVGYANVAILNPADSPIQHCWAAVSRTRAATSPFHTNKRKSLPESPTLDTRPSTSNVTMQNSVRYGCSPTPTPWGM